MKRRDNISIVVIPLKYIIGGIVDLRILWVGRAMKKSAVYNYKEMRFQWPRTKSQS